MTHNDGDIVIKSCKIHAKVNVYNVYVLHLCFTIFFRNERDN